MTNKPKDIIIKEGDVFEFQHILNALNIDASSEEWNTIGKRAFELKKYTFAIHAFEKGGNNSMVDKIKELLPPEGKQQAE